MANLNSERQINSDNEDDGSSEDEGSYVDGIYIPPPIKPACSLECKGPRLIITHINNNFFKSYAQNVTLGPFHKCFNSIIGPNGSGKSNVIDSMLFVFGFRANEIRSKKLSVLIHNSEKYKNVESATVSVHFAQIIDKEGDDYEIVPNSRFYVSRTVMKDNSSFYYLNDRKVKYKEIKTLLSGHGIDLDHKRFLILQGEVEQIASMKCKGESPNETGILEYLEDIVGTTRYIKPLQQLHERVETLDDAKSEKVNRLRLVQSELEKLKEPMEEAVEYLKTENSLAQSKNIIYQKNIFELEKKSKLVEEDKSLIEANKQELEAKIHELTEKRKEKERKWEEESGKHNSLTKRKATLKEAFDKANNKDVELQAEMVQVNKNRKKTIQLLAEERKKLETLEKTPQESEKGIEECLKREKTITAQKEKLETEKVKLLENIKTETQPLQEKKEELENKLMPLNKKVNETKAAYDLAESELKICQSNEENEKNKYENLKSTYENSESLLKERKEQVVSLKNKIPLTQKSLTEAINELKTIKQEQTEIRQTVNTKRASLEEIRSSMQASKSRSKVLDSLMQQKQDGKCPGLFGRLGDLGAIDQKYDVAISTACGPLDNIVVDTVSTAQWCIEFLKEYDIGRATFIALEKQEHLRDYANTRIQTPENVPRLFDLIKVQDDRVKTAFYYALRDTLVVSELEQASRIAYGAERYRVVTLNGDLIETTGTMSGGGRTTSRGRMGQSVKVTTNVKDIEKYEKELENAEVRFQELRNREIQLDKQIEVLEPELRKMKIDYEKYSIELKTLTEQQPMILKQLKTQEQKAKSTKSDAVQVKKLTDQVHTNKAAYDKAVEIAQKLQVEVDELTKEIKAKTIGRMKKMDKDINDAVKSIEKLQSEITRLKVSVKTAERNAQKSTEKIKGMEQDVINSEQRLRDMNSQRSEIETDGEKLLKCIEEIENELKNGESGYAEMKEEVDQLKKMLNKLKSEEVDVNQRLKTITGKINEINSTMHQWNVKISQLKLQDIPDTTVEELKTYTEEELDEKDIETVEKNLKFAENKLKSIKPNLSVLQEYRKKQEIYLVRAKELDEISEKRREMKGLYDKLREQRKEEFSKGFEIIRLKLKEMYQMITLGGDADFEYVDTFDAFTEGIQFIVRPPKKSWKRIENLSGGERTLSSLALVFALHYYKPSPLYVMDEIDAALDFKNVSIVGHYIKERTKNAQFIIISLRSQMFELGDTLVGIYKTYNTTKTIAISPKDFDKNSNSNTRLPTNQDNEKTNDGNNDFNSEKQNEDSNIGLNSDIQNDDTNLEEQNDDTNTENHNGTSVSEHQNISSDTSSYKTAEERIIADSFEEMDVD